MRENDRRTGRTGWAVRPRFMVWENVPGTFSSNGGQDFQTVLTEIVRIAEPEATDVPLPDGGKWPKSGCLYDEMGKWSIAWRVHDAQFWGVPQRRKRIALIADLGGLSAPEILFERKGLSWNPESIGAEGQATPGAAEERIDKAISSQALNNQSVCYRKQGHPQNEKQGQGWEQTETNDTLNVFDSGEVRTPTLVVCSKEPALNPEAVCIGNGQTNQSVGDKVGALNCMHDQQAVICDSVVRRLTPLEYERLQGFPDGWTDIGDWVDSKGKNHKSADSLRYRALGNSIAIPFWFYLLRRISAMYERPATLGSLFDGIGGFPLCWERCNGPGTALWASEIEEFPIAVTKAHFPEK